MPYWQVLFTVRNCADSAINVRRKPKWNLYSNPKLKWICRPVALDGRMVPSGFKKSYCWSPFHNPRSPLVWPWNDEGAAKTIESESWISVTVTDISEGNATKKELFCGRDTATESLRRKLTFVKLWNSWNIWPLISTSNPPEAKKLKRISHVKWRIITKMKTQITLKLIEVQCLNKAPATGWNTAKK